MTGRPRTSLRCVQCDKPAIWHVWYNNTSWLYASVCTEHLTKRIKEQSETDGYITQISRINEGFEA